MFQNFQCMFLIKINVNPLNPMSDQDRISPNNINTKSTRTNILRIVTMVDSRENNKFDLGVKGLKVVVQ